MLELAVARELYERYPDFREGQLAKIRSHVVSRASCAVVARRARARRPDGRAGRVVPQDELDRLARNRQRPRGAARGGARARSSSSTASSRSRTPSSRPSRRGSSTRSRRTSTTRRELQEALARARQSVDVHGARGRRPAARPHASRARRSSTARSPASAPARRRRRPSRKRPARRSVGSSSSASSRLPRRRHRQQALASDRVHLRAIKLRGFKSFPDPVEVRLEPGVAVVVGPNGSGKSNVADALLWASGSLAPSELRAEKPDDVLFAGGRTAPAGRLLRGRAALRQRGRRAGRAAVRRGLDHAPPAPRRRGAVPRQRRDGPPHGSRRAARRRRPRLASMGSIIGQGRSRRSSPRSPTSGARSSRRRPGSDASSAAATAPS